MAHPRITLDQWNALVAIVEEGSYAKAAERLNRTQSTITYTIKKLEELLGVAIFRRQGRKSVLTASGTVLYRRGKSLVNEATQLERAAADLGKGWEPEVRIAADIIFPTWLLLDCLSEFSARRPDTRIEVIESVLGGTEEALLEGKADLAISSALPGGFIGDTLMQVHAVCAAAPSHPLHRLDRSVTLDDLRRHRHLIVRDSGVRRSRSPAWLNEKRWTVSHKATSIRAACMGLGYAWYPEENIREELVAGALKPLPMLEGGSRLIPLYLVFADRDTAGPGTRLLADILIRGSDRVRPTTAGTRLG
jgi:DNA-binding transcriptional LysR family regulator